MTVPPVPSSPAHISPSATGASPRSGGMPEAVRYFLLAIAVVIGGEFVHQMFTVAMTLIDPSTLLDAARDAGKSTGGAEAITENQMRVVAYLSVAVFAGFALIIVAVLGLAAWAVAKQKSWANNARGLLTVFSVFFALRMVTVFFAVPAGSAVPVAVVALDGVVQIITGVAGICAAIFANNDDTKKWTAKGAKGGGEHHNESIDSPPAGAVNRDNQ